MSEIRRALLKLPYRRCYSTDTRFAQARCLGHTSNDEISSFNANEPMIFKKYFSSLPAITNWFTPSASDASSHDLDLSHLEQYSTSNVPLELTRSPPDGSTTFERFEAPLSLLLAHMTGPPTPNLHMYLAQYSLADLPAPLQADLPTPSLVAKLGRGDIYASSLWMGRSPTRTPLHRDPNPNLFVQLAGQKVVRLMRPDVGRGAYERVRLKAGGGARANMRGEEMMAGDEMQALEDAVWDNKDEYVHGLEAQLSAGDGLYIPLGWWHAVRGTGTGANASVSRNTCNRGQELISCRLIGGFDEVLQSTKPSTLSSFVFSTGQVSLLQDDIGHLLLLGNLESMFDHSACSSAPPRRLDAAKLGNSYIPLTWASYPDLIGTETEYRAGGVS